MLYPQEAIKNSVWRVQKDSIAVRTALVICAVKLSSIPCHTYSVATHALPEMIGGKAGRREGDFGCVISKCPYAK